jgi:hypothetical protein
VEETKYTKLKVTKTSIHGTSGTAHSLLNIDILERSFNLVFRDGG